MCYDRFESAANQEFLQRVRQEVNAVSPETSKEEIISKFNSSLFIIPCMHTINLFTWPTGACKTYFRSLKDDNRRKSTGVLDTHRKDLKVKKRLKQVNNFYGSLSMSTWLTASDYIQCFQKLKQRQQVITEAAQSLKWTSLKVSKVNEVLTEEYMSSETSADESDCQANSYKVRDIPWLRKRYKRAFHALDKFYTENRASVRSRKMTRLRVRSKNLSERSMPSTVPLWAVADAYRNDDQSDPSRLNTSTSSVSDSN